MLGLCKCCSLFNNKANNDQNNPDDEVSDQDDDKKTGGNNGGGESILEEKVALIAAAEEAELTSLVILQQPSSENRKLSADNFEEDSGTCVDTSNSSEMLDNIDRVQLTVSSVNSILPDLPEQDDDYDEDNDADDDDGDGAITSKKPLLLLASTLPLPASSSASLNVNGSLVAVTTIRPVTKTIPLVVSCTMQTSRLSRSAAAAAPVLTTASASTSNYSSTESVKPSALKKPRPHYSRQCSAPSSSSSVIVPTSSEASSRRNSGEDKQQSSSIQKKSRERSPCVSFDADVVYVESTSIRARSRSDASSRFKGKIAWLRDRRDAQKCTAATIDENEAALTPHRPRTRSDSRWIKINRKKAVEKEAKAFEWSIARSFGRFRQKYTTGRDPEQDPDDPESLGLIVQRSHSVSGLTKHEVEKVVSSKLKRHSSERGGGNSNIKKSVAFENGPSNWWTASMKLLFDKSKTKKTRHRHLSSDARNELKF
jgi:hypothetical protein